MSTITSPMDSNRVTMSKIIALAASATAFATALVSHQFLAKRPIKKKRSRKTPKYKRAALLRPLHHVMQTPWKQLLSSGCDDHFLVSVNLTKDLFLNNLSPLFQFERIKCNYGSPYCSGPKRRGRPPAVGTVDILGMTMWYLKTKASMFSLCPIFGIVPSSVGVWLDYGLEVLLKFVRKKSRKDFEVRWPTFEEQKASASVLERNRINGGLLKGVFGITDGGRMLCADYTNVDLQNAYFEGFTQNVEVTNLFVWNFFGEIIHAAINYPGSWHDTKLAGVSGLYYPKLSDEMTPAGHAILGDSAFVNNTKTTNGKILRGRKSNEVHDIPESAALSAVDVIMQRVLPSERQSAEWGVRALKGPFQRLKTPLPADSRKRMRIIRICVHLFNFRTRFVGLNQIRSTYGRPMVEHRNR